jgi:hypothetical protein
MAVPGSQRLLFRMRNVVQESKRNKWRVARRDAPFMPDYDLE